MTVAALVFDYGFDPTKIGSMTVTDILKWEQMAIDWEKLKAKQRPK